MTDWKHIYNQLVIALSVNFTDYFCLKESGKVKSIHPFKFMLTNFRR